MQPPLQQTHAPAEVDEVAVAVDGGEAAVGDLAGDDGGLEGVVLEQLQRLLLGHHQPLERLPGPGVVVWCGVVW